MNRPVKFFLIITIIAGLTGCTEFPLVTVTSTSPLPPSLKGYELYSWPEGSDWYFTLITGTNRTKTLAEITSQDSIIEEGGWVKITVLGLQELEFVLERLPRSEQILWVDGSRFEISQESSIIALPPDDIVEQVHRYSSQKGFNLQIIK
jgi:hypothetical protein